MTGADSVTGWRDLLVRASLLFEDCGLAGALDEFEKNLSGGFSKEDRQAWLRHANSQVALACIRRFSAIEGDTHSGNPKGAGRISAMGFPRLGGVLHDADRDAFRHTVTVVAAVERAVQASYLSALLLLPKLRTEPLITEEGQLWEVWLPEAYTPVGDKFFEAICSIVADRAYWEAVFGSLQLKRAFKDLQVPANNLNRLLAGLSTVGAALAIVERQQTP